MINGPLDYLRRHAVAFFALFVALGGTSYAVSNPPANSVGTAQLKQRAVTAEKLGRLPGVNASSSGTGQEIPDGTFTAIHLQEESFDIGGMHESGTRDTRVVAPRTGTYVIQGTVIFTGGPGGPPRAALIQRTLKGGGKVDVDRATGSSMGSEPTALHAGAVVRMRAGEYVELLGLQRSSASGVVSLGKLSAAYVGS